MRSDRFGQTTSLQDKDALRAWDNTQMAFLAHGASTPQHLGEVLTREPGFALGHAVKGMFYLLLGRRELVEEARTALRTARNAAAQGGANAREARYVEALAAYLDGRPTGAIAQLDAVLRDHPEDPLAMKLGHAIRFVLGDAQGMRASIEQVLPAYAHDHAARGYLLGCHAFALEETGAYRAAEIAGRQALWLAPDDAWGLHAVAHVYDMSGDAEGGLGWLAGRDAAWSHCNNFRFHVWWHKALMHLDLGQIEAVLALYDARIRAETTDDYRDISNAASLLQRLELEGVDVGQRWEELAAISERRTEDGCLIFADLHYLLSLIGGGRAQAIDRLVARIAQDADRGGNEIAHRMADPGRAAAAGLAAFGEGDYDKAYRRLAEARPAMQMAGGSHAQRDIFERMTIDAALRAAHITAAEALLNDRQARRGGREDGFSAARRDLIAEMRGQAGSHSIPAQ